MQVSDFEKIREGDHQAFSELFTSFYPSLYGYALRYTGQAYVAEELVQEFFLTLWERRSNLQVHTSIKAYLYTSFRNLIFNHFRAQLKNPIQPESQESEEMLNSTALCSRADEHISEEELKALIQQAIAALPAKCRVIFSLSRHNHMGYKEIAQELSLSVKTVENQMSIALKKLRKALHEYI